MIPRLALIVKARHDGYMTSFLIIFGIALALGLLSLRYGVDSRRDDHPSI
jgi:hypothetical protein